MLNFFFSNRPVARNLVYHVAPGDEVIVTLKGWNYDGQALKATITSLPQNGEIYQLSQVFSDYG
jgi:protein involved in polysaccharide export with SLBB domain